jgi:transcription termination/antitermination protein NusG
MNARWYIIHAYSGFEKKVAEAIKTEAARLGLTALVEEVVVPTEEVTQVVRGQKRKVEQKFFPGYVLAKMIMNDDAYHLVRNTPKVTGFLGPQGKPQAITDAEASRILNQVADVGVRAATEKARPKINFEIGDSVKVIEGPFASFNGLVEGIDSEKGRLKVSVSIFGRPTPVDLEFGQVEKSK